MIPAVHVIGILIIRVVLGVPVGAVLLQLAVRVLSGIRLSFGKAVDVFVVTLLLSLPVAFLVVFTLAPSPIAPLTGLIAFAVNLIIAAENIGIMVRDPRSGQSIGFGKGALVTLLLVFPAVLALAVVGFSLPWWR